MVDVRVDMMLERVEEVDRESREGEEDGFRSHSWKN